MYTLVAIQLRRYTVLLDGKPEQYSLHPEELDTLSLPYERGQITTFIEPNVPVKEVYPLIDEKARQLRLGCRLATEKAMR